MNISLSLILFLSAPGACNIDSPSTERLRPEPGRGNLSGGAMSLTLLFPTFLHSSSFFSRSSSLRENVPCFLTFFFFKFSDRLLNSASGVSDRRDTRESRYHACLDIYTRDD